MGASVGVRARAFRLLSLLNLGGTREGRDMCPYRFGIWMLSTAIICGSMFQYVLVELFKRTGHG